MFFEPFLIIVGAVLASTIGMVNAAFGGLAQGDGHVQRPDHQVTFHTVADGPANDAARKQIQDNGQIQPAFAGPDICDVAGPFLVRCGLRKVPIQQIRSYCQGMIAVRGHLAFPCSDGNDAVFSHQTPNTTLPRPEP